MMQHIIEPIKAAYRVVRGDEIEKLMKQHQRDQDHIRMFLDAYDPYLNRYCSIQNGPCKSCGLMVWEKDAGHRYTQVNDQHLQTFYGLLPQDRHLVIGRNAGDLIREIREETGMEHTFGEICISTDDYTRDAGGPLRFFELGYRDGQPLLLDVYKEPIFHRGDYAGSKGNALDMSVRESAVYDLLQYYISMGLARRIDSGGKRDVAAYIIDDTDRCFDRDFPKKSDVLLGH